MPRLNPRRSITIYFLLTFTISWFGALAVALPPLLRGGSLPKLTGILMFPAMLLGPSISGIALTRIFDGNSGLRSLVARMTSALFPPRWWAALLIPPALILAVLTVLARLVDPVYTSNLFLAGIFFGVPAGFLEEIGWTGFAYPRMCARLPPVAAAVALGVIWSLWHLPVINYLGTATPHGNYWFPYFLAFGFAMTAMRVLISWVYDNTGSVLLAQTLHAASTGSLVVFSPAKANAAQEVFWYAIYGALLWIVVFALRSVTARTLHQPRTR